MTPFAAAGVAVADAEHVGRSLGGVQRVNARTVASAFHGLARDDARTRQELLAGAGLSLGSSLPEGHCP